jgi:hypothetical protein
MIKKLTCEVEWRHFQISNKQITNMKVKLDDYKIFNKSRQYNKHITYKLKQTYNRCKGNPYTQSSNFEKNNIKTNQLFSPITNF